MRMKEVCAATGLTEKSVRLYQQRGLVTPRVEQTAHGNAYFFEEKDVARLRTIAALRGAGFHLAEIEQALNDPAQLPALVDAKRAQAKGEQQQARAREELLKRLDLAEQGDPARLAAALAPPKGPQPEAEGSAAVPVVFGVLVVLAAVLLTWYYWPGWEDVRTMLRLGWAVLGLPTGLGIIFMALRYGACTRRAARLPRTAMATVIAVRREAGFDIGFARAGNTASQFSEHGRGGIWQILFLAWNAVRPDHWYPVLQYRDEAGTLCAATVPYGALKHTFKEGQQLAVADDPAVPGRALPLKAPWLRRKALAYAVLGLAVVGSALLAWRGLL